MSLDQLLRQAADELKAEGDRQGALEHVRALRTIRQEDRRKAQILAQTNGAPVGVELALREGLYALISEEPDGSGRGRMTMFDERGFSGHCVFSSAARALDEAFLCGYATRVDGVLDRLAQTKRWQDGIRYAELVAQHNAGALSFDQMCEARAALFSQGA